MINKKIKKIKLIKYIFIIIWIIFPNIMFADNPGTVGAAFLRLGSSAKSLSLGNCYSTVKNGINSAYGNPAMLHYTNSLETKFTHNKWFADISHNFIGWSAKLDRELTAGFSIFYLDYGNFDGYDKVGNKIADPDADELVLGFTSSMQINPNVIFGVNIKYLKEQYENYKSTGYAFDFGFYTNTNIKNLKLGAVISNVGQPVKFVKESYKLPLTYRIGFYYIVFEDLVDFTIDFSKSDDLGFNSHYGAQFTINDNFLFRTGYSTTSDIGKGISVGFGVNFTDFKVDYAYLPFADLGETHRLGLTYKFGYAYNYIYKQNKNTNNNTNSYNETNTNNKINIDNDIIFPIEYIFNKPPKK